MPMTGLHRVDPCQSHPLFDVAASRRLEAAALASLSPSSLMQRAGLSIARLGLALAPHARRIWVAAGPGNNGGDGIEAAIHFQQWGLSPVVTWLGEPGHVPPDAQTAWQRARNAGVDFSVTTPESLTPHDLVIDALLGIGGAREPAGPMADWIARINQSPATVLAVDMPTGLDADSGAASEVAVQADATLSLLGLKPGLFMQQGRDLAGSIWFDPLGVEAGVPPVAWLNGASRPAKRAHNSHKGSYGDVAVLGGEGLGHRGLGMHGAATLAAIAALHGGAGRVLLAYLGPTDPTVLPETPELMLRTADTLPIDNATVVCGCGGGELVRYPLPRILSIAPRLVLDADALNAIAEDPHLHALLRYRVGRGFATVLTPHPLEAARLLGSRTSEIQANRLSAARELVQRYGTIVVLKGSGSIIAAPDTTPLINPTGNARLACAGTGDVLAGLIGAYLAQDWSPVDAAKAAVWQHGRVADNWTSPSTLTAAQLARSLTI
jgi:ADP-dependent NAD(P)H-hydrate dehydratase / NAD(P)H-hydrate epimerase